MKRIHLPILAASTLGLFVLMACSTADASGVIGLGQMVGNVGNNAKQAGGGIWYIVLLTGFVVSFISVVAAWVAHKRRDSMMPGVVGFIVGVILVALPVFMGSVSVTAFGSNQSQLSQLGIGN